MSQVKISRIATALLAKGFRKHKADHIRYFLYVDEKKTDVFTFHSHAEREADEWLQNKMAKQLRITRTQLAQLVDCTLSGDEYVAVLRRTKRL